MGKRLDGQISLVPGGIHMQLVVLSAAAADGKWDYREKLTVIFHHSARPKSKQANFFFEVPDKLVQAGSLVKQSRGGGRIMGLFMELRDPFSSGCSAGRPPKENAILEKKCRQALITVHPRNLCRTIFSTRSRTSWSKLEDS